MPFDTALSPIQYNKVITNLGLELTLTQFSNIETFQNEHLRFTDFVVNKIKKHITKVVFVPVTICSLSADIDRLRIGE